MTDGSKPESAADGCAVAATPAPIAAASKPSAPTPDSTPGNAKSAKSATAQRRRGFVGHSVLLLAGAANTLAVAGIVAAGAVVHANPEVAQRRFAQLVSAYKAPGYKAPGQMTAGQVASITEPATARSHQFVSPGANTPSQESQPSANITTGTLPTKAAELPVVRTSVPDTTVATAPAPAARAEAAPTRDGAGDLAQSSPLAPPALAPPVAASNEPPIATPKPLSDEAQHIARFDKLIAPVRDHAISVEDATRVRDAFAAGKDLQLAKGLRDQITDPVAKKLVDWHVLRLGGGTAREVRIFLDANPDWPNRDLLKQRAEEDIFTTGGSAAAIKAYFEGNEPTTAIGQAALASAFLADGNEAGAATLAARAWRQGNIPATLESGFIERFGKYLAEDDHKWRLNRFLLDDQRWEAERKDRAALIKRIIPFLSEPERAKANARLAIFTRAPEANKLLAALPADAATKPQADWGFAFQLAQWHRRAGRFTENWDILLNAPTDTPTIVAPDDWWEERRVAAYEALKAGKPQIAYDLVKAPGQLGVNARKDQTFMAGWLALRHLDNAKLAEPHFKELQTASDGPLSRGKAGFWQAKVYEAQGQPAKVKEALTYASKNIDTFYGQLALQRLGGANATLNVTAPQAPSADVTAAFSKNDAVRAVVVARRAGLDLAVTRALLAQLRNRLESEPEQALIAHLSEAVSDTQMAVRVGKSAVARGLNLVAYSYPIHAMPTFKPLRPSPELALLLGIARQESEFHTSTKSGAGARGLMQVMPVTATHVCRDYRLTCEIERLGTDPAYNAMMGSAYIGDRMDEFSGSYVLTIAGYNAGPGRARQWIREFGDPRDPKIDPIDWIHRIPFEETREYVLKVLSNLQIYRARLGEAQPLRLEADLRRTAPPTRRSAAVTAPQN